MSESTKGSPANAADFSIGHDRLMREVVIYYRSAEWKRVPVGDIEKEHAEAFDTPPVEWRGKPGRFDATSYFGAGCVVCGRFVEIDSKPLCGVHFILSVVDS